MEDRKPDMKIIDNNPYRLLGVYANSPTRERVANEGKIKAFLKVGKQVPFPLDLRQFLPIPNRTEEMVADAKSRLTLPADQIKYAQFWFLNVTQIDKVAFRHLVEGDMDSAIATWSKAVNTSSLQNRIVCHLMRKDYSSACGLAEKLYAEYASSFVGSVAGDSVNASPSLAYDFLDALCDEIGTSTILKCVGNADWKKHISAEAVSPVIARLQSAVDAAQATRGKGPEARYDAGMKLMNGTKDGLAQLRTLLPTTDLQYQMIADKLGLEILGCGIDYYNDSNEADAAQKAMELQQYSLDVVVGKMAKDRCLENVNILKKIIAALPPQEVFAEDKAIRTIIQSCRKNSNNIDIAILLLQESMPYLKTIASKLGSTNDYYLSISTLIVSIALNNVIGAVNNAQGSPDMRLLLKYGQADFFKQILRKAWKCTTIMDRFDMEPAFQGLHYEPNRNTLESICANFGISTSSRTQKRMGSTDKKLPSKSTPYEAAFVDMLLAIIIGLIGYNSGLIDNESDRIFCLVICCILGVLDWIYPWIERKDDFIDDFGGCLGYLGCLFFAFTIPLFIHYWLYKGIRYFIARIKNEDYD